MARPANIKHLNSNSFSKRQLVVFVLVFALIGGYILLRSFASNTGGAKLAALYAIEDAVPTGSSSVTVSTSSALAAQAASPTARIVNVAAGTYAGAYDFSAKPSQVTKYVFAPGVKFTGGPCCNSTSGVIIAVRVSGSNLILWGPADITNPNYDGVRVEDASNIVLGGGMTVHNDGMQGILVQNSGGGSAPTNIWLDGVQSYTNGTAAAATAVGGGFQPCTGSSVPPNCGYYQAGLHSLYWGPDSTGGGVVNSYFHDQPNGYCVEVQNATSGSVFAFNTLIRCTSTTPFWDKGSGFELYSNSSETYVGNIIDNTVLAGIAFCNASGSGMGNVFWNNPTDVLNETCGGGLTVSDSHDIDPQLDINDRPQANSPLTNLDSTYAADYLPRTDYTGATRTTADPGAFETSSGSSTVPTVSLTANPTNIASGNSSSLSWTSTNATSCTASGAWNGTQPTSGSQSVSPSSTSTYSLTCTGSGGTSTPAMATVTVTGSGSLTIGETNVLTNSDSGNANLLVAQSTTLSQTATIQSLSFYVTNAAGLLRLGLYDASGPGGGPGALKAQTAEITPVVGWNTYNITSQVSLPAGTYWLAYFASDNNLAFVKTSDASSSGKYYSLSYGALPSTFSTAPSTTTSHWSLYATLSTGGGGTAPGDVNGDGHVNITDLSILLSNWNTANSTCDLNHDGTVNIFDLSILLSHYGS